ncbi:MAG: nitroreductase [Ktedonobacteraceae bacterium]|nr:nitroreductase [Chloroflexota bacterium]
MNTFTTILVYGIPASLLLSAIILIMELINPRLMLRSYPKDVKAAVSAATPEEKRQTLVGAVPFWFVLLGFPIAAALSVRASNQEFLLLFLSAFGVMLLANLVDWLILDWLIFCTITPKFVILPGTEGLAGYKNYAMHFRGFLIGTALSVIVSLIIAGIIHLV